MNLHESEVKISENTGDKSQEEWNIEESRNNEALKNYSSFTYLSTHHGI